MNPKIRSLERIFAFNHCRGYNQDQMSQYESDEIKIRPETPADEEAIHAVNASAFRTEGEAKVVDRLREVCNPFVSLVAEMDEQVVGHILFTPVTLKTTECRTVQGMGLAPLAVLPAYQGRGIGSALCNAGLDAMAALDTTFVVVLGHPGYYPRFGFTPAAEQGFQCGYPDTPPEAFMIRVFDEALLNGLSGVIYYRTEFDDVT